MTQDANNNGHGEFRAGISRVEGGLHSLTKRFDLFIDRQGAVNADLDKRITLLEGAPLVVSQLIDSRFDELSSLIRESRCAPPGTVVPMPARTTSVSEARIPGPGWINERTLPWLVIGGAIVALVVVAGFGEQLAALFHR